MFNRRTFPPVDAQVVGPADNDLGDATDPRSVTNLTLRSRDYPGVDNLQYQVGIYNLFGGNARLPRGEPFIHAQGTLDRPTTQVLAGLT